LKINAKIEVRGGRMNLLEPKDLITAEEIAIPKFDSKNLFEKQ